MEILNIMGLIGLIIVRGIFIENCVTCCEDCNKAKRDKPYNEFLEWIQKLVQHSDILFKRVVNAS